MSELHADDTDDITGTDNNSETCAEWFGPASAACQPNPPPQPSHILLAGPRPLGVLGRLCLDKAYHINKDLQEPEEARNNSRGRDASRPRRATQLKIKRAAAATGGAKNRGRDASPPRRAFETRARLARDTQTESQRRIEVSLGYSCFIPYRGFGGFGKSKANRF